MSERGPESLPTTTLGQYKVRAKIGSGGMGDVYDATHTGLDKRVAIKTLRKRFLDDEIVVARFLREGQLASRIRHPHIVDVTDVGVMGGLPCLVMEHLEGESFSALIRREGRLHLDTIVDLLLPIIAAVDFAHDHGIVHRDLKPSNIFLSRSWNGETVPKVLDFGISKLVHDSQQAALTTDSAFIGTPHYASPELMRADKLADGRSDQYSMGVILYEAATGVRPFADLGNNFVALAMAICKGEYIPARQRNPDIAEPFDRVIQRSMSLLPHDRFLSMRALGEALIPFASDRARMIWGPTFASAGETPNPSGRGSATEVLPRSSAAMASATVQSRPPFSGAAVSAPPNSYSSRSSQAASHSAHSAGVSTPISHASHPSAAHASLPPLPSMPPFSAPYSGEHGALPSATPPGAAFDRLPSYGAGTAVPVARPRGSGVITAVIGVSIGLAILVSVIVLRGSRRADDSMAGAAARSAETFTFDVRVTPASATMELDGIIVTSAAVAPHSVEPGRLSRSFPRDGRKHALRLSAPGYESLLLEFDDTRLPPSAIGLRPVSVAIPTSATPPVRDVSGPAPANPSGPHRGAPAGKAKGSSDGRPKTDNIDPFE